MTFREVLQIEVWSKSTTRKILVASGTLIGILVLGVLVFYQVETHWLTAKEQAAATEALKQIDGLQGFGSLSDHEFETKSRGVEAAVDKANGAAFTERDKQLAFLISAYFEETRTDREELQIAEMMWDRHLPESDSRTQFGKKIDLTGTEIRTLTRLQLHKILD